MIERLHNIYANAIEYFSPTKTTQEILDQYKQKMQELKYFRWSETYDIRIKNVEYEIKNDLKILDGLRISSISTGSNSQPQSTTIVHNLETDRIQSFIKNPRNWEYSVCKAVKTAASQTNNLEFKHCEYKDYDYRDSGRGRYELTFTQKQKENIE